MAKLIVYNVPLEGGITQERTGYPINLTIGSTRVKFVLAIGRDR